MNEVPKLIIRVIYFELVQPVCSRYINIRDGQMTNHNGLCQFFGEDSPIIIISYFRYQSSTRVLDKILSKSTRVAKTYIRTALLAVSAREATTDVQAAITQTETCEEESSSVRALTMP